MTNRQFFYHYCRGCHDVLLPYGESCNQCRTVTPLPVVCVGRSSDAAMVRIGITLLSARFSVSDTGMVSVKTISRVWRKQRPVVNPHYIKMIESVIARAKGIL